MASLFSPRLTFVSASIAALLSQASFASASECEAAATTRWYPERSWPSSCELDVPVDGFVLLEGSAMREGQAGGEGKLEVSVLRVEAGATVETFSGAIAAVDETSALFRSDRALAPHANYVIVARRVGADGAPEGGSFSSAFRTGAGSLAQMSFRGAAQLSLEEFEREDKRCALDACGAMHCEPSGESKQGRLVRIAVPPIDGGIALKPYSLTASLSLSVGEQAPAVATSDSVVTQAGKRSFMTVELPPLAADTRACITLSAKDIAGHESQLEAGCLEVNADPVLAPEMNPSSEPNTPEAVSAAGAAGEPAPALLQGGHEAEQADEPLAESVSSLDADPGDAAASEGCSVGAAGASAPSLSWFALALTLARLRSRKR